MMGIAQREALSNARPFFDNQVSSPLLVPLPTASNQNLKFPHRTHDPHSYGAHHHHDHGSFKLSASKIIRNMPSAQPCPWMPAPPLTDHTSHGSFVDHNGSSDGFHAYSSADEYHQDIELLQSLCQQGNLDHALDILSRMYAAPPVKVYLSLLKACSKRSIPYVKRVYDHLIHHRVLLSGLLGGYLVMTLAKCGAIDDALQLSSRLPHRSVFSWTSLISAYADCGQGLEALKVYNCMMEDGVEPNSYTFVSLFKACGSIPDLAQGKQLHEYARKKGMTSVVFISNSLLTMYGKCGAIVEAERVFGEMAERTVVSWTAMLSVYVEQGQGDRALKLYRQMQEEGFNANQQTFVVALQACAILADQEDSLLNGRSNMPLEICEGFHADARLRGFESDIFVATSLLKVYAKCGNLVLAEHLFQTLSRRDLVSWNSMLSACIEQGQGKKALHLYQQMQEESVCPDELTYVSVFQACGILREKEYVDSATAPLEVGLALHVDACMHCLSDPLFDTALVSMYGKCGAIVEAEEMFTGLEEYDTVSWNAMLSAYVEIRQGERVFELYEHLQKEGVNVNDVTIICLLQACRDVGSLELTRETHFDIVSAGYDGFPYIAAALINAYGSCACMVDAQAIFDGLPIPDAVSWTACIGGHAAEGNALASFNMFENLKLEGIRPDEASFTAALSACGHSGEILKGHQFFRSMSERYNICPDLKHFGIMLDLLGRAGDFMTIQNMLQRLSNEEFVKLFPCLLSACQAHGNVGLAEQVFEYAVNRQCKDATLYVLMSNIFAESG